MLQTLASIIGYTVIAIVTFIALYGISVRLYRKIYVFIRKKFYRTRLWWEIHTIRVHFMKIEKMTNNHEVLLKHKELLQIGCPKDLLEVWVNKIDLKLEDLRNEIKSHGEIPSF